MEHIFGLIIRHRREELGLTQEELADRVVDLGDYAMRQSDISRIERGYVQMPRLNRLEMLAGALEMHVGVLLAAAGYLGPDLQSQVAQSAHYERPARTRTSSRPPVRERRTEPTRNPTPSKPATSDPSHPKRQEQFVELRAEFEQARAEFEATFGDSRSIT